MKISETIPILQDILEREGDLSLRVSSSNNHSKAAMGIWTKTLTSNGSRVIVFSVADKEIEHQKP